MIMMMMMKLLLLSLLTFTPLLASSSQTLTEKPTKKGKHFCDSWRLSVETNNVGVWATVPSRCVHSVAKYMNGDAYLSDSEVAAGEALDFARGVGVAGDGKDVWVFDVDETLLSNLPYYKHIGYGSKAFNETSFDEWAYLGKAPALPASLKLYKELQGLGFELVLLTGRYEEQRAITEKNLLRVGYHSWNRLIMRGPSERDTTAVVYKSGKRAELISQGYRIHGCSGDQWSDLVGSPMATRSFKLPDPLYFIS